MNPYMLGFVVFVVVTSVTAVVGFMLSKFGPPDNSASDRLEAIVGRRNNRNDSSNDLMIKQSLQELGQVNLLEKLTPEFFKFSRTFEQADLKMQPSVLFGIALAFGFVGAMISTVLVNIYASPIGGLILFSLPFIWLWVKKNMRMKKFASQLPEGMELVARALRAGHSLASGLHVVAHEMPEPICKEFARVYEEQNLGMSMEDSLDNLCKRVPNLDLRFFVTSVNIQRQTGGDLAEILDRIGHVIRERYKILGQVKALTAEGRLSGLVLIALPIGLFLMMLHMKPDYVALLWTDKMGQQMSIGAIILMLIGSYAIKKIVDIKV